MAKKETTPAANLPATAGNTLPATAADLEAAMDSLSGQGLENMGGEILIPRLTILQALSPQMTKSKPEYNPDAKVGMICDTGTQELFTPPLLVVPVHFSTIWLEWAPRNSGKGLVGVHENSRAYDACEKDERGRAVTPQGNLIVKSAQFFVLNLAANNRQSFIPMSSTQYKKAKQWNTWATSERRINARDEEVQPPLYYRTYKLSSVSENNAQGNWEGWKIEKDKPITELPNGANILKAAIAFRKSLLAGEVKGDVESVREDADSASHSEEGAM